MQEFDNFEKVSALFAAKGFPANAKYCVMWKYVPQSKNPFVTGGMAHAMAYSADHPYSALLVGIADNGIAYYHLNADGVMIGNFIKKVNVKSDTYTFIPDANIKAVKITKFAPLNNRIKTVDITLSNGERHHLQLNLEEKPLAYQKFGADAFIDKYADKK